MAHIHKNGQDVWVLSHRLMATGALIFFERCVLGRDFFRELSSWTITHALGLALDLDSFWLCLSKNKSYSHSKSFSTISTRSLYDKARIQHQSLGHKTVCIDFRLLDQQGLVYFSTLFHYSTVHSACISFACIPSSSACVLVDLNFLPGTLSTNSSSSSLYVLPAVSVW